MRSGRRRRVTVLESGTRSAHRAALQRRDSGPAGVHPAPSRRHGPGQGGRVAGQVGRRRQGGRVVGWTQGGVSRRRTRSDDRRRRPAPGAAIEDGYQRAPRRRRREWRAVTNSARYRRRRRSWGSAESATERAPIGRFITEGRPRMSLINTTTGTTERRSPSSRSFTGRPSTWRVTFIHVRYHVIKLERF